MNVWCIYLCSLILDSDVCIYDAYILDPDTCGYDAHTYYAFFHYPDTWMYDAFIYVPWSWLWCMCVWCTYLWSWSMHVCMVRQILLRTNGPTNKAILGVGRWYVCICQIYDDTDILKQYDNWQEWCLTFMFIAVYSLSKVPLSLKVWHICTQWRPQQ